VSEFVCGPKCWTRVPCPDHGNGMNPLGRSAPIGFYDCCENYAKSEINPRHLWDKHDSSRYYTDPLGWADHEKNCEECSPEEDDE